MRPHPAINDQQGSASAELVLILPMLLALMFGGFEAGHFVWTQHKLVTAVRDGARFAARLNINVICGGDAGALAAAEAKVRLLTRTGQLANPDASPLVPNWTDGQVSADFTCNAFMATGIYSDLDAAAGPAGPIVTVTANGVKYPSLFEQLGFLDSGISLTATSHAAVTGL